MKSNNLNLNLEGCRNGTIKYQKTIVMNSGPVLYEKLVLKQQGMQIQVDFAVRLKSNFTVGLEPIQAFRAKKNIFRNRSDCKRLLKRTKGIPSFLYI